MPWPLRGQAADAALAAGLFVVISLFTLAGEEVKSRGAVPGLGWVLIVIACGALYWRRRHPALVALITVAACCVYYPLAEPDGPLLLTFVVSLYTAAAEGRLWVAAGLSVVALMIMLYGEVTSGVDHLRDAGLYLIIGWFVAVVAIGAVVNNRRAYLGAMEQRALAAERTREEEARRRATEERLRIARELHDVLGHNISLINVQANAALHGLHKEPSQAETALVAIKDTSKETLRELRATLGVLRQVDERAPVAPAPGLKGLPELTERTRAAGGPTVSTEIQGDPRPLPPEADLAAYRIVQEALTNVTKHAGATAVVIRVVYTPKTVQLHIDDDGESSSVPTPGNGIRGMQERAQALGGTLTAAPNPDGGFRVQAHIPA
ncbi:sensor histidine kinase [Actinomadura barringtoniae]|uniref:histidine kinase n=1 Tax=Actinomadura barringtoniae TaxID=1427535 RepID=A0A939PIP2_9ACTN|nr:sensor histidine kinase [Actinomadura barringtoniae]